MKLNSSTQSLPDLSLASQASTQGAVSLPMRELRPSTSEGTGMPVTPRPGESGAPYRRMSEDGTGLQRRASMSGPPPSTASVLAPRQSLDRLRSGGAASQGRPTPPVTPQAPHDGASQTPVPTPAHSAVSVVATPNDVAITMPPDAHAHATNAGDTTTPHGPPKHANGAMFFLAQNVRHAIPVAGVRTVVQGVVAPELARAVQTHPAAAIAAQAGLTAWSVGRRIVSQMHSERHATKANEGFSGDITKSGNSLSRQVWQGVQTLGIVGGDAVALGLTIASTFKPELVPVAQAAASLQLVSHLQAQVREFARPMINTVHVGHEDGVKPPDGRNLRGQDVNLSMKGTFGLATAGIDMLAQLAMQSTLGGVPAWKAGRDLAAKAGAIAGAANMLTSSVEDHLVETAQAKRMQGTDPSHVRHLHLESKNPLKRNELERQFERVDARVFNTIVPGMIAIGLIQAMRPAMADAGWKDGQRQPAEAGLHAAVVGLMGGALLAYTVAAYQMNDAIRKPAKKPETGNGAASAAGMAAPADAAAAMSPRISDASDRV